MTLISREVPPRMSDLDVQLMLKDHYLDICQLVRGEKGVTVKVKDISSAYTVVEDDAVLFVWGDTTISLPAADTLTGRVFWVKDISTNQVTVDAETLIDDVTRQNLAAAEAMCIVSDGVEWRVV